MKHENARRSRFLRNLVFIVFHGEGREFLQHSMHIICRAALEECNCDSTSELVRPLNSPLEFFPSLHERIVVESSPQLQEGSEVATTTSFPHLRLPCECFKCRNIISLNCECNLVDEINLMTLKRPNCATFSARAILILQALVGLQIVSDIFCVELFFVCFTLDKILDFR